MKYKFMNISNHPSIRWSEKQLDATREYAPAPEGLCAVEDLRFPNVPADAEERTLRAFCADIVGTVNVRINEGYNVTCMVQGESTLTYMIVDRLLAAGIKCVAATTERNTIENEDGSKTVSFDFVRFREYVKYN